MSDVAPMPDFTPAQPSRCAHCGNSHHTEIHPVLEVLNRQTEMLAVIAGILGQKTFRLAQQAIVNAGGFATIAFPSFPGGVNKEWLVDRVFLWTNSSSIAAGVFVLDGTPLGMALDNPNAMAAAIDPLNQHDFTNLAIAAGEEIKPLLIKGGETLAFQWSGATVGAKCIARVQYRQVWAGID